MATNNTTARALRIHQLIKGGSFVTAARLVEELEISKRQVAREIEFLRDRFGAPIAYDHRTRSYTYTEPTYELPSAIMSEGEVIAILVAHQALLQRQSGPLSHRLNRALSKLRELLPAEISLNVGELLENISFMQTPGRTISPQVLEATWAALTSLRTVRMRYHSQSSDETSDRELDIYHLTSYQVDWYIIGWCHRRKEIRMFAVSRIQSLTPTSRSYKVPPSFNPKEYVESSLGISHGGAREHVVLQFAPRIARWVRELRWHPSQREQLLPEGGLRLELEVSNTFELRQWILSFGPEVEVLEPPSLRSQIVEEITAMATLYGAARPTCALPVT